MPDLDRLARLCNDVALVGAGDTDYPEDYRKARDGTLHRDAYGHAAKAFTRALKDSGLERSDIDGLIAGPTLASERLGEVLGINPRWAGEGDAVNAIIQAALAVHAGLAECVALVYGNDQRSVGTQYGGPQAMGGERYLSYVYYRPWGMTSQGALYALMTNRYMELTGLRPEDLAGVAVAQRRFAGLNPNAIMRKPLTVADYMQSRFICEPLRLFDYCLINDGGVALIVTTADRAKSLPKPAVLISGIGRADTKREATSLWPRLIDFYRTGHGLAAEQVYQSSGAGPDEIDLVQIYDSFSVHVPFALQGFGFCSEAELVDLLRNGGLGPGGRIPVNTSGGHLSESYMQGWNHQVEIVRQLRGEAGARQVPDARTAQYISDVAGSVVSLVFRKGG